MCFSQLRCIDCLHNIVPEAFCRGMNISTLQEETIGVLLVGKYLTLFALLV